MRFTTITLAACAALLSMVAANTVEFINQDGTTRTLVFTPNNNQAGLPNIVVGGNQQATVSFPHGWIGNWYSVSEGAPFTPGMLGEVAWDGYNGMTYFDVSAIVNPNDMNGVKMMYPKNAGSPLSGCQTFPCSNAYNLPEDLQTLSTTEKDIICLIGNKGSTQHRRRHPRHFVTGK